MSPRIDNMDQQKLLISLRRGDFRAFETLFERLKNDVHNFLRHLGATPEEADEGLQEVFTRLWEKRSIVRTDARIKPFLLTIARNNWINERKKHGREFAGAAIPEGVVPGKSSDPADILAQRDISLAVKRAVDSLDARIREPFVLFRYQELTYREIQDVLGITHRQVEYRIVQAYEKLRIELAEFAETGEK